MAPMTRREYLNTLPPEEAALVRQQWEAEYNYAVRKRDEGTLVAGVKNFGAGAVRGLVNATVGLGQLPLAVSNAALGTDFDTRPVFGPGSMVGQDSFDQGAGAGLGNFAGFLGSFMLPGGVAAKAARAIAGGSKSAAPVLARGVSRALAPDLALAHGIRNRLPQNIVGRALGSGAEFGLLSFARTPGELGDRAAAGAHSVPAGLLMGAVGRAPGVVVKETGERLTGNAMQRWVRDRGGMEAVLRSGEATLEHPLRYALAQGGRMGAAGMALPGMSPAEMTGNPNLDSAIFNAGFGFATGFAGARPPAIQGRARAVARDNAQRAKAEPARQTADARQAPTNLPEVQSGDRFRHRDGSVWEVREVDGVAVITNGELTYPLESRAGQHVADKLSERLPRQRQLEFEQEPVKDEPLEVGPDHPTKVNDLFGPVYEHTVGSKVRHEQKGRGAVIGIEAEGYKVQWANGTETVEPRQALQTDSSGGAKRPSAPERPAQDAPEQLELFGTEPRPAPQSAEAAQKPLDSPKRTGRPSAEILRAQLTGDPVVMRETADRLRAELRRRAESNTETRSRAEVLEEVNHIAELYQQADKAEGASSESRLHRMAKRVEAMESETLTEAQYQAEVDKLTGFDATPEQRPQGSRETTFEDVAYPGGTAHPSVTEALRSNSSLEIRKHARILRDRVQNLWNVAVERYNLSEDTHQPIRDAVEDIVEVMHRAWELEGLPPDKIAQRGKALEDRVYDELESPRRAKIIEAESNPKDLKPGEEFLTSEGEILGFGKFETVDGVEHVVSTKGERRPLAEVKRVPLAASKDSTKQVFGALREALQRGDWHTLHDGIANTRNNFTQRRPVLKLLDRIDQHIAQAQNAEQIYNTASPKERFRLGKPESIREQAVQGIERNLAALEKILAPKALDSLTPFERFDAERREVEHLTAEITTPDGDLRPGVFPPESILRKVLRGFTSETIFEVKDVRDIRRAFGDAFAEFMDTSPRDVVETAADGNGRAKQLLDAVVTQDLSGLNAGMFDSARKLRIEWRTEWPALASFWPESNTLTLSDAYLGLPRFARRLLLMHELNHGRQPSGWNTLPAAAVETLFRGAGYPTRNLRALMGRIETIRKQWEAEGMPFGAKELYRRLKPEHEIWGKENLYLAQEAIDYHFTKEYTLDGLYTLTSGSSGPNISSKWVMVPLVETVPGSLRYPSMTRKDASLKLSPEQIKVLDGAFDNLQGVPGVELLVAPTTTPSGAQILVPFRSTYGTIHQHYARAKPNSGMDGLLFVNVDNWFLSQMRAVNPQAFKSNAIAGRDYGYSAPTEFLAEAMSHYALNGAEILARSNPGMVELLQAMFRNRMSLDPAGVRALDASMAREQVRQGELFSPQEFLGPQQGIEYLPVGRGKIVLPGTHAQTAPRMAKTDAPEPRRTAVELLFDETTGFERVRHSDPHRSEAARVEEAWKRISRPQVGVRKAALRNVAKDPESVNAALTKTIDRLTADLEVTYTDKEWDRVFTETLREEAATVMGKAAVTIMGPDGEPKPLEDFAQRISGRGTAEDHATSTGSLLSPEIVNSMRDSAARVREGKGRLKDYKLIFEYSPLAQEQLTEKLHRVFTNGVESLAEAIPSETSREILRLKFGSLREGDAYVFRNPDGTPVSAEGSLENAVIAARVGVSTRTVSRHIHNFIWHQTVDLPTPSGILQGRNHRKITFNRHGDPIGVQDVAPDPTVMRDPARSFMAPEGRVGGPKRTTRKAKEFQFRQDGERQTGRIRAPKLVETVENGQVVKQAEYRAAANLEGGVRGRDKYVVRGDVDYIDPVTGEVLTYQSSLFETKQKLAKRVAAEKQAGVESAKDQKVAPPEPGLAETRAQAAATSAVKLPPEADAPIKEPKQLRLKGAGFGRSRKTEDTRWKSNEGVAKYALRVGEARAKIGERGMTPQQFDILTHPERIEHVITRLARAKDRKQYTRTLGKYAKFLGPEGYETFHSMANTSRQGDRVDLMFRRAEELHMEAEFNRDGSIRLSELDTGRTYDVKDVGTVGLLLDLRATRLREAPDVGPREFSHITMRLPDTDGAGGGPRPPHRGDRGGDREFNGEPPRPELAERHRHSFIFSASVRSMRDLYATVGEALKDSDIFRAVNMLIDRSNQVDLRSQRMLGNLEKLAKTLKVDRSRGVALGRAAADLDDIGYRMLEKTGSLKAAEQVVNAAEQKVFDNHGLAPNEQTFLRKARQHWDKAWNLFLGDGHTFVPGYFARWRNRDGDVIAGTLRSAGMPEPSTKFFASMERRGQLQKQSLDYFEVFSAYARSGWRNKLMTEKVRQGLSPLEYADAVVRRYSESQGGKTVYPYWADPMVQLIERAKGTPDPGMLKARNAVRGRLVAKQERVKHLLEAARKAQNLPARDLVVKQLRKHYDDLGVKISDPNLVTWADYVIGLNRSRAFGLNVMRSIRHVTQSSFFTLPRVGPKYFGKALNDVLDPQKFERIFLRATAEGVIKPAYAHEYINSRSKLLSHIDKLSWVYRFGDIWERTLSFHAQTLKSSDAMNRFKERAPRMGFKENFDKYAQESGLTLLHPAFRRVVREALDRPSPNYSKAIRQHAKLLVDHTLFDYTRANQPVWSGNIWGRLFGQYGRWTLGAIETMNAMTRYGTTAQRMQIAAMYALVSASVYGIGQALGVKTADWIPFVHTLGYGGGPTLSILEDAKQVIGGDPIAGEQFAANWRKDPAASLVALPFKMFTPAGDVIEALWADSNLSRRERNILGIPRRARSRHEQLARLYGFRPLTDAPKHSNLLKAAFGKPFEPAAKAIKRTTGALPSGGTNLQRSFPPPGGPFVPRE